MSEATTPTRSDALVIRGGTVVDATGSRSEDVAVVDGTIVPADAAPTDAQVVDASGCVVTTGLVDLHAHLGEPGDEAAETMLTAGRAAVLGGYTTLLAMPNSTPPVDTAAVVDHVRMLGQTALCDIEVAGSITVGAKGERLSPLGELAGAGVRFVVDCGVGVQDPLLMRRALEYSRPFKLTVAQPAHCAALGAGGQMHEGAWSSRLGMPGTPAEAEEIIVMRDIALARLTGARVHFQTLSTAGSLAIVGAAQRSGVHVSSEVAAHHLSLCDADLATYDTNKKVEPPFRAPSDVEAARTAIANASLDAIVTDHTPHSTDRKERPFDHAEPGSVGLETSLAVALTAGIDIASVLRAMSWRPAELLGLGAPNERTMAPGSRADITVIDPNATVVVATAKQATSGTNSAFEGVELTGQVRATIVNGQLVVNESKVLL